MELNIQRCKIQAFVQLDPLEYRVAKQHLLEHLSFDWEHRPVIPLHHRQLCKVLYKRILMHKQLCEMWGYLDYIRCTPSATQVLILRVRQTNVQRMPKLMEQRLHLFKRQILDILSRQVCNQVSNAWLVQQLGRAAFCYSCYILHLCDSLLLSALTLEQV